MSIINRIITITTVVSVYILYISITRMFMIYYLHTSTVNRIIMTILLITVVRLFLHAHRVFRGHHPINLQTDNLCKKAWGANSVLGIHSPEPPAPQRWERKAPTPLFPEPGSPSAVTRRVFTKQILDRLPKPGSCG